MVIRHGTTICESSHAPQSDTRIRIVAIGVALVMFVIVYRLFTIMILQHDMYVALAAGSQDMYAQLYPVRGQIYVQDSRMTDRYPVAINRDVFTVYADTRQIQSIDKAESIAEGLADVFHRDDEKKLAMFLQLNKRTDPYEPLEKEVEESVIQRLKEKNFAGIAWVRQAKRYYPEKDLTAQVVGFVGKDQDGNDVGRYGVEGYWQKELAGTRGFIAGATSLAGKLITLAGGSKENPEDGADIVLTIDRALQFATCKALNEGAYEYGAETGAAIIMDPHTGAVRAMCSYPTFDPNTYNQVENTAVYNNHVIFTPYEPGSVFKPITMAGAINEGVVTPDTSFYDTGERSGICQKPIKNALLKAYEWQTMTGVLENSINTGMVFVVEKLGKKKFLDYVERFGFGMKEGIQLDTEVTGTVASLSENKGNDLDCYTATGSFGQGLTATPLQLATAFSAIANGGTLYRPYIVDIIEYTDGRVERTRPVSLGDVITERTARLVSAMMVRVIDSGQAKRAGVPGYYIAGKTGTAQISGVGGYSAQTNHTFVGFGPTDDAKFVMVVKFEKPDRPWADGTAAPVFGKIAKFIMEYYHVPPVR